MVCNAPTGSTALLAVPVANTTCNEDACYADVTHLTMAGAVLTTLASTSFDTMTKLVSLALRGCAIERVEPGTFGALLELETLDLHNNRMRSADWGGLPASGLPGLPAVTLVSLASNQFEYLAPALHAALPTATLTDLVVTGMGIDIVYSGTFTPAAFPVLARMNMWTTTVDSQCLVRLNGVTCACAPGHTSPANTFCEPEAPALPAPESGVGVNDTVASVRVTIPPEAIAVPPGAVASLTVRLKTLTCTALFETLPNASSCGNATVDLENEGQNLLDLAIVTTTVCCDGPCGQLPGVPTCAEFAALPPEGRTVSILPLRADTEYTAVLVASNTAGLTVASVASSNMFRTARTQLPSGGAAAAATDDGPDSVVKIVATVGILLAVMLLGFIAYRYHHHVVKMRPVSATQLAALLEESNIHTNAAERTGGESDADSLPEEVPRRHVEVLGELGQGAFGTVVKALLNGWKKLPSFMIAVKEAKRVEDMEELLREAVVMHQFHHPNILRCIGIITRGEGTMVLMEFCEHGDLKQMLRSPMFAELNGVELLSVCAAVAQGAAHFAALGYVHRDLAARNVLVSSNYVFKICDFGLGRKMDRTDGGTSDDGVDGATEYYRAENSKMFPLRWTAPEAFTSQKYSAASDVWSWAVLSWETLSRGTRPYPEWSDKEVWVKVSEGEQLQRPNMCSETAWTQYIMPCFDLDPSKRPAFAKVAAVLETGLGSGNAQAATLRLLTLSSTAEFKPKATGSISWTNTGGGTDWTGASVLSSQSQVSVLSNTSATASVSKLTGDIVSHDYYGDGDGDGGGGAAPDISKPGEPAAQATVDDASSSSGAYIEVLEADMLEDASAADETNFGFGQ